MLAGDASSFSKGDEKEWNLTFNGRMNLPRPETEETSKCFFFIALLAGASEEDLGVLGVAGFHDLPCEEAVVGRKGGS